MEEKRQPKKWTEEAILSEIKRVMKLTGITDRMPSAKELNQHSSIYNTIAKKEGGMKHYAQLLGLAYEQGFRCKCVICGKEFISKGPTARYCSAKCRHQTIRFCPECGKEFRGNRKYCSNNCKNKAKIRKINENNAMTERPDFIGSMKDIRPSKAFDKEQEAREYGLHYADIQKAETLRLAKEANW